MDKIKSFPQYLTFKDRVYSINGYIDDSEVVFKDNKGYIDRKTNKIYICSKDNLPVHDDVPIIYVDEDGYRLKEVNTPQTKEVFQASRLFDLSYQRIIDSTTVGEALYNEEALADMNAATSVFVPTINEDDDPLKKIVKQTIITKQIDINRLKHKLPEKYALTNMKSALIGKTKMSITNFVMWMELLECTFDIIISDNHRDKKNPLPVEIHYNSKSDSIEFLHPENF